MRTLCLLTLFGTLTLTDVAAAQWSPPRPYPIPGQYYPEDPAELVRSWYRRYLNREGDAGGVATWVNSLRQGNPPESTLATILASDEYFRKAGGSFEGLVHTLFLDLTGRRPPGGEFSYWVTRFHRGERVDVIYDLLLRHPQDWQSPLPVPVEPAYPYQRPYRYYDRP